MRSVRDLATISAVWAALVVLLAACGEPLPPKAVPAAGTQAAPSTEAASSTQASPDSQAPGVSTVTQSDGSICTSIQQTAPPNSGEAVATASCVCSYDMFSLQDAPVCYPRSALRSWTQPGGGVAGSRLDQIPIGDLSFNPLLPAGLKIHAVSTSDFGVSATDPSLGRIIISEVQDESLIGGGLREQTAVVKGYSGTVTDRRAGGIGDIGDRIAATRAWDRVGRCDRRQCRHLSCSSRRGRCARAITLRSAGPPLRIGRTPCGRLGRCGRLEREHLTPRGSRACFGVCDLRRGDLADRTSTSRVGRNGRDSRGAS